MLVVRQQAKLTYQTMKRFRRTITLLGFVLLIVLASLGMGIAGAVPIPQTNKRKETIVIDVEEVDEEDAETDVLLLNIKQG